MAHEIFIEPELEMLSEDSNAAEWFEICSALGLQNQISLADKSETKKAPPYQFCDPKTMNIIRTICPRMEDYKMYKSSTIPTDVLKEIQKCVEHKWYSKINIHYDNQSPDPFVIGSIGDSWNPTMHLIARWGNELLPFEELERKAIARKMQPTVEKLHDIKAKVERAIADPTSYIQGELSGSNNAVIF